MVLSDRIKTRTKAINDRAKQIVAAGNISDMWDTEEILKNAECLLAAVMCEIHKRSIEETIETGVEQ